MWLNGVYEGTWTVSSYNSSTDGIGIGATQSGATTFNGYISSLRYSNTATNTGTSNITLPTAPLTSTANTVALLNATNAGIYDAAAKNYLETVGDAQVSTTQAKFGTTSMKFDGTGDQIVFPNSSNFDFGTGNFTIECWLYLTGTTGSIINYSNGQSSNSNFAFELYQSSSTGIQFSIFQGTTQYVASSTGFSINAWNYVAAVRNGNTMTIYVNGTAGGTTATVTGVTMNNPASSTLKVSGYNNATGMITGYVDELRITKGYARTVTSSPTAAFPIQ
jgi:hypothetical protein